MLLASASVLLIQSLVDAGDSFVSICLAHSCHSVPQPFMPQGQMASVLSRADIEPLCDLQKILLDSSLLMLVKCRHGAKKTTPSVDRLK